MEGDGHRAFPLAQRRYRAVCRSAGGRGLASVPVGVDVELHDKERFSRPFAKKTLTRKEKKKFKKWKDISDICNLLWTKKEAIFKMKGKGVFRPKKTDSLSYPTKTVKLDADGKEYYLSVAATDMGHVYVETTNVAAGAIT